MLIHAAETRFQRGLEALEGGRGLEALALFEAAIELERKLGSRTPQARYLSYYGLCLATAGNRPREGVDLCKQAIALEFYNADLCCNYGRVLLAAERRRDAYAAFIKGLKVQRGHQGILREISKMGWRRRPVLPFLDRRHPLNVALGKMFHPAGKTAAPRARASGSAA